MLRPLMSRLLFRATGMAALAWALALRAAEAEATSDRRARRRRRRCRADRRFGDHAQHRRKSHRRTRRLDQRNGGRSFGRRRLRGRVAERRADRPRHVPHARQLALDDRYHRRQRHDQVVGGSEGADELRERRELGRARGRPPIFSVDPAGRPVDLLQHRRMQDRGTVRVPQCVREHHGPRALQHERRLQRRSLRSSRRLQERPRGILHPARGQQLL